MTTWPKRHADFPKPVRSGDIDYFSLAEILGWLDTRPVPVKALRPGEADGTTYADRVRHSLSGGKPAPSRSTPPTGTAETTELVGELLGRPADSVRDTASMTDYLDFLLVLVFVRGCASEEWERLCRLIDTASGADGPEAAAAVLRGIGEIADEALRRNGLLPGVRPAIERLRTLRPAHLAQIVRSCDRLDGAAFALLLEHYEATTKPDSERFLTPRHVTRLMADILIGDPADGRLADKADQLQVHDPYARGGELLAAAADALSAGDVRPALLGESPFRDTLRLAGMRLALDGRRPRLKVGTTTPWDQDPATGKGADFILTNPPFNMTGSASRERRDQPWPFGPPPPGNDNFAWLQHVVVSLAPHGRAAVIMPNRASVSSNRHEAAIRRDMVEQGVVESIIALPPQLFPNTSVAATIWVLRCQDGSDTGVLFVDARGMGTREGARRFLSNGDVRAIADCHRAWRSGSLDGHRLLPGGGAAVAVTVTEIQGEDCLLDPSYYVKTPDGTGGTGGTGGAGGMKRRRPADGAGEDHVDDPVTHYSHVAEAAAHADELRRSRRDLTAAIQRITWGEARLSDLCEIQAGPSPQRLKPAEAAEITGDGVPVIRPKHLRDRRIVVGEATKVSEAAAQALAKFRLTDGDILAVRTGSTGPSALVETEQEGWLFGSNLLRIRRRESADVDPEYLLGFLSLPAVTDWIHNRSMGTTAVPFITAAALGRLVVPLPPLPEQRSIGTALRTLDRQIVAHQDFVTAVTRERTGLAEDLIRGI